MKRGITWIALTCFMVASLVLASCSKSTTTSTSIPTTKTTTTTSVTTSAPLTTTAPTTTIATGNWWDSLGKPQYGGEMVIRIDRDLSSFDPVFTSAATNIESAWMDKLHTDDWTIDPAVFDYRVTLFRPSQYVKGSLASTWEFTDPSTYVVNLRKGIHWQDIPPANGREFTADDVVFHYDRLYGLGDGFTKPSPYQAGVIVWQDLISATAIDKYTVAFKFKTPNAENIMELIQSISGAVQNIENPEAVKLWGDLNDWHHAIGTGPFILKDFVSSSSATLVKNPNYWGYDERYPQNQIPYIDTLRVLIIPDQTTVLAAMRTGKIDQMDGISLLQAQNMKKSNPEILQISGLGTVCPTINPRNDKAPFNDIRVRKAMQMAIDLPTIAKSYYGGAADPSPATLTSRYMKGWAWPYEEWPQDLKDEYAYNPTAAKKLLADAGYPNGFKTNIVADTAGDIDLLQIVKSYFDQVGINMEIRLMDTASWTSFVLNASKHDQMATRSVGMLDIPSEPLRSLTKFTSNNPSNNYIMVSDPIWDTFSPKAMTATSLAETMQVVRDANEYVARQHLVISLVHPFYFAIFQPWLKGYNGQVQAITGGGTSGPQLLGFYTSRFWIDQNLKKSMGY